MTLSLVVEHFDDLLATPEDVEQVNTFILQLALQGKLVEQNTSDESGLELLQHIYAERTENSRSILAPIKESDKPFALPAGWAWARLGDIIQISSGKSLTKEQMNEGKIPVYGGNGITGYHDEALVYQKTIVIGRVGFYCGSVHLTEDKAWVTDNAFITTYPEKYIHREYLVWLLRGTNLKENENATAQPVISGRKVYPINVGIPPLLEQKRIAARLEELFVQTRALAKELARSQIELDGLNKSALSHLLASETPEEFNQHWDFIAQHFDLLFQTPEHVAPLRQSILELAVRGKLTRREVGDESAGELLKQLIKTSTTFQIKENEKPFDLPEGWEWFRFKDISEIYGGKTPSMNQSEYWDGDIPWVSPKDMWEDVVVGSELMITTKALDQMKLVPKDSLLIVVRSGILKRRLPVSINAVPCTVNQDLKVIVPNISGISHYLQLMLQGLQPSILKNLVKQGTTVQSVKWDEFISAPFPLPPLAEQERIVKRVEQLLSLCDALEARLQSAEEERKKLVAAVMSTVGG
jgi:type I restriction enzyme S subunit